MQEVRNAVDQAAREIANRFDFKDTNSSVDLSRQGDHAPQRQRGPPRRPSARCSRRSWSSARCRSRRSTTRRSRRPPAARPASTSTSSPASPATRPPSINKFIKALGLKGVQSQVQGDQLRVSGKKRDDLQAAIQRCGRRTSASPCSSATSGTEHGPGEPTFPACRTRTSRASTRTRRWSSPPPSCVLGRARASCRPTGPHPAASSCCTSAAVRRGPGQPGVDAVRARRARPTAFLDLHTFDDTGGDGRCHRWLRHRGAGRHLGDGVAARDRRARVREHGRRPAALQPELDTGDVVVCDRAVRDEGVSHHYLPSALWAEPSPG